jgi:branched-chain amino acid transport system permease protein
VTNFLDLVVTGLAQGTVYALIAIGFVIILKCSQAFNIAQGHFVMIGGYLGFTFLVWSGMPLWAAVLAAIATAIVMGLLIERLTLRPLVGQPVLAVIMMTIALGFCILDGLAVLIWGGEYLVYPPNLIPDISIRIGEIYIPPEKVVTAIVSIIAIAILLLFFRYAKVGLMMRATAEDEQVVQGAGVKVSTIYAFSWIIASITGVIAGILLASASGVSPALSNIGLKAFAVVLLGGANSVGGAIIAGLIVGVAENLAAAYLDPFTIRGGLANVFPFIIMIIVLIIRPNGLFGLKRIERI